MAKKTASRDRWPELCSLVKGDDQLITRDSGHWAEDKLRFWHRYIEITTAAMADHPAWDAGLVYVDMFSGPGICSIRGSGRRIPGSPIIAANSAKAFKKIILCEMNPAAADACSSRMKQSPASNRFEMLVGDSNKLVDEIAGRIPKRALVLAFLDIEKLDDLKMETIIRMSQHGRVDILVLFPDATDIVRNIDYYLPNKDSPLDKFLGKDSKWRQRWMNAGGCDGPKTRLMFADIYKQQLKDLAKYVVFGDEVIYGDKGPMYRLMFASKHERGLEFWDKVRTKERSGQRRMDLD